MSKKVSLFYHIYLDFITLVLQNILKPNIIQNLNPNFLIYCKSYIL